MVVNEFFESNQDAFESNETRQQFANDIQEGLAFIYMDIDASSTFY
jgi:hypothetical protein